MKMVITSALKMLIIISLIFSLTGCWNRRELNTLAIVLGIGIDKSDKDGEFLVTAQVVNSGNLKSSSGKDGSSEGSAFINLNGTGKDIFYIMREFTHQISRKLYLPHNQIIVFGEDYAKEGVRDSLEMFLRDHETRSTVNVMVAKGKAADIFKASPEFTKIPASDIAQLVQSQGVTSETAELTVMDFMTSLISKTGSSVAPIIEINEENDKKIINLSGGAVFKADKFIGELDKNETRGYLWVMDKIKSGTLMIEAKDQNAVIEIIKSKTEVKPEIKQDGTIVMKIKVNQTGKLSTQTGSENLGTIKNTKVLQKASEKFIKEEIQNTINKAFEMDADIFGFGESLNRNYHKQWKSLEDEWDNKLKNIEIEIDVKSTIVGNGRLAKPDYPEKG